MAADSKQIFFCRDCQKRLFASNWRGLTAWNLDISGGGEVIAPYTAEIARRHWYLNQRKHLLASYWSTEMLTHWPHHNYWRRGDQLRWRNQNVIHFPGWTSAECFSRTHISVTICYVFCQHWPHELHKPHPFFPKFLYLWGTVFAYILSIFNKHGKCEKAGMNSYHCPFFFFWYSSILYFTLLPD